jgi:rSAM/selenodomain-associated transferase 2
LPDNRQLSIIIPVLNEADCLEQSLGRLFALPYVAAKCEVIVCDGGSTDGSQQIARRYPCRIEHSEAGRARQMNQGASVAGAPRLLFLHADTRLAHDFDELLANDSDWGFFRLKLNHDAAIFRVIESAINLRSRISSVAGGDQCLYFSREFFQRLGGFETIPLMEDIAICKAARRLARPAIIESAVVSSSRRWQQNGVVKTILLMWALRLAFWVGVSPARLHRIYYPQKG